MERHSETKRKRFSRRCLVGSTVLLAVVLVASAFLFLPRRFKPKTPGRVRFALCQCESRLGDPRWSFDYAMRFAKEAAGCKADVVVFPEFSFSSTLDVGMGPARYNLLKRRQTRRGIRWFVRSNRCYLVVNHPASYREGTNSVSRNETLVFTPDGHVMTKYWKRVLSSMDIGFGFEAGRDPVVAEFPFGRVGLMICKDSSAPMKSTVYREADLVLIQFADIALWGEEPGLLGAPFAPTKVQKGLDKVAIRCSEKLLRPILMVNKTGLENEYLYVGGSRALAADGTEIGRLGTGCGILYVDFPLGKDGRILPDAKPVIPEL